MVHPCEQTLDGVDDNTIGCLTPHGNSSGTERTMLFHGVDGSVNGGESHLTHLIHEVDYGVKQNVCGPNETKRRSVLFSAISNERKEIGGGDDDCVDDFFNANVDSYVDCCVDVAKEDGVNGSVDGGESHLTYCTNEVDCGVKQNVCGPNETKRRSVMFSAISNEEKEVDETMLLYDIDDSVDGGESHLTNLTRFESNDIFSGCENFKHIVKNNSESLR
eukprot:1842415-Ditylum_brightwellii.AAC.1